MTDITALQQKIVAYTNIPFDSFFVLVYEEKAKAQKVAQSFACLAEADAEVFDVLTSLVYQANIWCRAFAGMTLAYFQQRFDDAAYTHVRRLARDFEEEVYVHGAYALGHFAIYREDAHSEVWRLCDSERWELCVRGAYALGVMGIGKEAQRRLADLLQEQMKIGHPDIRYAAYTALAKLHPQAPKAVHRMLLDNLYALKNKNAYAVFSRVDGIDEPSVDGLLSVISELMQDQDYDVNKAATLSLYVLIGEHPHKALPLFLDSISHKGSNVAKGYCMKAFCDVLGNSFFPTVAALAVDENPLARQEAAKVLGRFHQSCGEDVLVLLECLADDEIIDSIKELDIPFYVVESLSYMLSDYPDQSKAILTRLINLPSPSRVKFYTDALASNVAYFYAIVLPERDLDMALDLVIRVLEEGVMFYQHRVALRLALLIPYRSQSCLPPLLKLAHNAGPQYNQHNIGMALEVFIDQQPEQVFALFDQFFRVGRQVDALWWIAEMGRREEITQIARCYLNLWHLAEAEEQETALEVFAASLADMPFSLERFSHGREAMVILEMIYFGFSCQAAVDFGRRAIWLTIGTWNEPFLLPEMVTFGRYLIQVRDLATKFLERTDRREREMLLIEMLSTLEQAEAYTKEQLYAPYQQVAQRLAIYWRLIVRTALDGLRGQVLLRMQLLSNQRPFSEAVDIGLEICNLGDETAENVIMKITACSSECQLIQADSPLDHIPPHTSVTWRCVLHLSDARSMRIAIEASYYQRGIAELQTIEFADVLTFINQNDCYPFVPLPSNPYVIGTPLRTADMFFGRDKLIAEIASDLHGMHQDNVIVLYGQRRTGKTSLLYALQNHLPRERYIPVFYDAEGVDSELSLFWGLANHIYDACTEAGISLIFPKRDDYSDEASAQFEYTFLREVRSKLSHRRLLLMIDEFESLEIAVRAGHLPQAIFPFLRRLMQHQRQISFIFCGTHKLQEMAYEYWQIFFNAALPRRVSFLDDEATLNLIQKPVQGYFVYDELALKRLLALTGKHPFFTQLLCHHLVRVVSERRRGYVTYNEVEDMVRQVVQTGHDHLDYIWEQSDTAQQRLLLVLAEQSRNLQQGVPWENVAKPLSGRDALEFSDIENALVSLEKRELVTKSMGKIRFTMGLISDWIIARHGVFKS